MDRPNQSPSNRLPTVEHCSFAAHGQLESWASKPRCVASDHSGRICCSAWSSVPHMVDCCGSSSGGHPHSWCALPKTLDCVILPIDVDDSFTNSARVPNSLLVSGVRAEYISGNRLDLTMNFVDELPPARTTTDPPPGSPQKATYSFIVQLDNTDSSALSVDFAPDGWEIREGVSGSDPFGDDATVNFNPNMTIGPDYVNLIIELDTLAYKPAKLDPTVSVETTRAGPGYDEQPFYATQDCK